MEEDSQINLLSDDVPTYQQKVLDRKVFRPIYSHENLISHVNATQYTVLFLHLLLSFFVEMNKLANSKREQQH